MMTGIRLNCAPDILSTRSVSTQSLPIPAISFPIARRSVTDSARVHQRFMTQSTHTLRLAQSQFWDTIPEALGVYSASSRALVG